MKPVATITCACAGTVLSKSHAEHGRRYAVLLAMQHLAAISSEGAGLGADIMVSMMLSEKMEGCRRQRCRGRGKWCDHRRLTPTH